MLLERLLNLPEDSPQLHMRAGLYGESGLAAMIREVMGLANAETGRGSRYILFGVSRENGNAPVFSKLSRRDLAELQRYSALVLKHLEPDLKLTPSIGEIQGHMVAVLEIPAADNPPYVVKLDAGKNLQRGSCWVYEGGLFRPSQRADLDRMFRHAVSMAGKNTDNNIVHVGFGGDPNCKQARFRLPDVSNPPSKLAAERMKHEIAAKQAAVAQNVDDTSLVRLNHARLYGNDSEYTEQGLDTLVEGYNAVMERYSGEDNFYFFETNALRLNFALVNTGHEPLTDVSLMLTFPWAKQFRVSDRLHPPPGKSRTQKESELLGYPKVTVYDGQAQVKYTLPELQPDQVVQAFQEELRISAVPELAGRKVRCNYSLHATELKNAETGELILVFAK